MKMKLFFYEPKNMHIMVPPSVYIQTDTFDLLGVALVRFIKINLQALTNNHKVYAAIEH